VNSLIASRAVVATILSAALGGVILLAARGITGQDPAATLAASLGLGSGPLLGALLGGLLGGWLALGGPRRIAGTAGLLVGLAFIFYAWRLARPYLWVLDIALREILGEGGQIYSGLVLFLIAIPLFRRVAGLAAGLAARGLERPRG
jgi:hypothetical protein